MRFPSSARHWNRRGCGTSDVVIWILEARAELSYRNV